MKPAPPDGATDEWDSGSSVSLLDDLQSIAPLILDLKLRDKVLARYDGPRRLVAEDALQFAGQLMQVTEWSDKKLLTELGCPLKTVGDLKTVTITRLQNCQKFLRLLSVLTGLVDVISDRRAVVVECAGLLKATRLNADGLNDLIQAGQLAETGERTPVDYIRLGEISAAVDLARSLASLTPETPRPEGQLGSLDSVPVVHLSTARIEMYIRDMREELGTEVSQHIEAHLEECRACREAVEYCRAHMADLSASDPAAAEMPAT